MTAQNAFNVPNVPIDPMYENKNGQIVMTSVGKNFFEQLISFFYQNFSNEGLVMPTQTASNIIAIQNFKYPNNTYKTQYGTMIYNSDPSANSIMIAVNDGSGAPIFKTVTLT